MKLLFDENVSPKLPQLVASDYPHSQHVRDFGLRGSDDQQIWDYARERGFAIVSKDTDFRERSFLEGFPPKVIGSMLEMLERKRSPGCCDENVDAWAPSRKTKERRFSFSPLVWVQSKLQA